MNEDINWETEVDKLDFDNKLKEETLFKLRIYLKKMNSITN